MNNPVVYHVWKFFRYLYSCFNKIVYETAAEHLPDWMLFGSEAWWLKAIKGFVWLLVYVLLFTLIVLIMLFISKLTDKLFSGIYSKYDPKKEKAVFDSSVVMSTNIMVVLYLIIDTVICLGLNFLQLIWKQLSVVPGNLVAAGISLILLLAIYVGEGLMCWTYLIKTVFWVGFDFVILVMLTPAIWVLFHAIVGVIALAFVGSFLGRLVSGGPTGTSSSSGTWTCPSCGRVSTNGRVCEACGYGRQSSSGSGSDSPYRRMD